MFNWLKIIKKEEYRLLKRKIQELEFQKSLLEDQLKCKDNYIKRLEKELDFKMSFNQIGYPTEYFNSVNKTSAVDKEACNELEVILKDTGSAPQILYRGQKVKDLADVEYKYRTKGGRDRGMNIISISGYEKGETEAGILFINKVVRRVERLS